MIWRFGKDWRGIRAEVPWVKNTPGTIIRDHVRLTVHPLDGPSTPQDRILEHLGSEDMLFFATDYPHWQFEGDAALPSGFPESLLRKVMVENPLATYPRLKKTV